MSSDMTEGRERADISQEACPPPCKVSVRIRDGDMAADIVYEAGGEDGEPGALSIADVYAALKNAGVVSGIDGKAIAAICAHGRYGVFEAARGTPPVHGEDGAIDILFNTVHDASPMRLEDGRVDFYRLNLYETVSEGQVLAKRRPATPGTPGVNVKGVVLAARGGRDAVFDMGTNTRVLDDGLSLVAARAGRADLNGRRVDVSGVYEVSGNVDLTTGNIDFPGDVVVRGNVVSGMTVKAEGNIEVHGVVEGAKLVASGDIVLRQGIQGADKGVLQAKGSVVSGFTERASIYSGRSVTADTLLHCTVQADDAVTAQGKHGVIIGGTVRAGREVSAQTIGNASHTLTGIEVGVLPSQRERLSWLEAEKKRLAAEHARVSMIARSFTAMPSEDDTPERADMRAKVTETMRQNALGAVNANLETAKLNEMMDTARLGRIHVRANCHGGVRISIGSASMELDAHVTFSTFKITDGILCITPFEK